MNEALFPTLLVSALTLGALHSLAPDHWVPFAAVGRARDWSRRKTGGITLLCGLGHVTVSALLGLGGLALGVGIFEALGSRMEATAGTVLLAFGLVYGIWGLYRATRHRLPGLEGSAGDSSRITVTSLFALFAIDPCVPLIPLVGTAVTLGTTAVLGVVAVYAAATLTTMTLLAVGARAGADVLAARYLGYGGLERWGHAAAGATIFLVAVTVGVLGI